MGADEGVPGVLEGAADEIIDKVDNGLDEIEKPRGRRPWWLASPRGQR